MISTLGFWLLDYIYALKWQLRAAGHAKPPTHHAGTPGKAPIILIPGVYEPWPFMQPLADVLEQAGYPIYFVAELGYHTISITDAAKAVRRLIDQLRLTNAVIVAHSKGGLVGKYLLSHHNQDHAISLLIAVAAPFSGSVYAQFWLIETIRAFSPRHPDITKLQADTTVNSQIVSIYGSFDPHIPGGSYLSGATNIEVPAIGHFRILDHVVVKKTILELASAHSSPNP